MPRAVVCLLALLLVSCGDLRQRAAAQLSPSRVTELRHDAAMLYKQKFSAHEAEFFVLRPREWPPSFQAFAPVRVSLYPDGIALALRAQVAAESGLHIVPKSMDHEPWDARGTRFEKIAEGIYWYSFGD